MINVQYVGVRLVFETTELKPNRERDQKGARNENRRGGGGIEKGLG